MPDQGIAMHAVPIIGTRQEAEPEPCHGAVSDWLRPLRPTLHSLDAESAMIRDLDKPPEPGLLGSRLDTIYLINANRAIDLCVPNFGIRSRTGGYASRFECAGRDFRGLSGASPVFADVSSGMILLHDMYLRGRKSAIFPNGSEPWGRL